MEVYKNLSLENLPDEEWRDIVGYEGLYQVSNMGRVKSLARKGKVKTFILKQHFTPTGYLLVTLTKKLKRKTFRTHQLVVNCFIPLMEGKNEINHIDEDKSNNKLSNLMRCDRSFNVNYGNRNSLVANKLRNRPDHSKPILQVDKNNNIIREFVSINDASRFYGITVNGISRVCRGKRNKYKNMFFKYK
jgi:hypothetical protein